jgi:hypothetical protein
LTAVTQAEFLEKWGWRLDSEQMDVCGADCLFLLGAMGGCAVKFKRKVCFVVMAAGEGLDFLRELVTDLKARGFRALLFYYKSNSPTSGLVRYVKGRRWVSRDTYADGSPAHLAFVRLHGKRLGNGKP